MWARPPRWQSSMCATYRFAAILVPSVLAAASVIFGPEIPANLSPSIFKTFLAKGHSEDKGLGHGGQNNYLKARTTVFP